MLRRSSKGYEKSSEVVPKEKAALNKKFSINLLEKDANYLDYVAKEAGTTRAELVRGVLEREVKKYKNVFGEA